MNGLVEATASVRRARRRLLTGAAADGAARGTLAGAAVGAATWLVAWRTSIDAGFWPLVPVGAGLVVGAAAALRRGVAFDVAALALDAAARTEEAFVSAVAAIGAVAEFRALCAEYAVARCPPSSVPRFLPFRAPAVSSAAAVAAALVAALVLVPRGAASDDLRRGPESVEGVTSPATSSGSAPAASPRERVDRLRQSVQKDGARETAPLAAAVRKDLGAVTDADLRSLAQALAAKPASADAANRALAALARDDRASAIAALREALGGAPPVTSTNGTGTETGVAPADSAPRTVVPWAGATWPLRYDRAVRRYLDETAASEASKK